MDEKTLNALKGSIEKWENIVAGTGSDMGVKNCALCGLFNRFDEDCSFIATLSLCYDCPVMGHTKKQYCVGSPYQEWENLGEEDVIDGRAISVKAREMARKELDFLKSLLPDTDTIQKEQEDCAQAWIDINPAWTIKDL